MYGKDAPKKTYAAMIKAINENEGDKVIIAGRLSENAIFKKGMLDNIKLTNSIKSVPMILTDVEWHWRYRNKICVKNLFNKYYHKIICETCNIITTFCEVEADSYSKAFDVDKGKFIWLPYCSDIDEIVDDNNNKKAPYFFTGGLHDRDYKTLFEALRGTSIRVRIATAGRYLRGCHMPDNVTFLGEIDRSQYFEEIGNSLGVVLSLDTTSASCSLRRPGVITYVTAMRMRKAVIVNDNEGAKSYIKNNHDGIIIEPSNHSRMRQALTDLWENELLRKKLADRAYERAHKHYGYSRYFSDLENIVHKVTSDRS
jgi:glycosyltransferase involved in cell wall biosynthesis